MIHTPTHSLWFWYVCSMLAANDAHVVNCVALNKRMMMSHTHACMCTIKKNEWWMPLLTYDEWWPINQSSFFFFRTKKWDVSVFRNVKQARTPNTSKIIIEWWLTLLTCPSTERWRLNPFRVSCDILGGYIPLGDFLQFYIWRSLRSSCPWIHYSGVGHGHVCRCKATNYLKNDRKAVGHLFDFRSWKAFVVVFPSCSILARLFVHKKASFKQCFTEQQ